MCTILNQIAAVKYAEVENLKKKVDFETLYLQAKACSLKVKSMKKSLLNHKTPIIAEFKRKSPSKGDINISAKIENVALGYLENGASVISVLTDNTFFGGELDDMKTVYIETKGQIPILRKDFIVDKYQICEAKLNGASAILLIGAMLKKKEVEDFSSFAHDLGLEVLLEIHNEDELNYLYTNDHKINNNIDIVGINNRNLKKFITDTSISINLADKIPEEFLKISESGINSTEMIQILKRHGYQGFLIGEYFMKTSNPAKTLAEFIYNVENTIPQIKICGMRKVFNISDVAALNPDYMGFILYEKSKRFIGYNNELLRITMASLPKSIVKVGVFVNASQKLIEDNVKFYALDAIQLHGNESVELCRNLKESNSSELKIIKVFGVEHSTTEKNLYEKCRAYEGHCDFFMFDTKESKCKKKSSHTCGGTGKSFNWNVLKNYKFNTPYFLSGGLGLPEIKEIVKLKKKGEFKSLAIIDVNSKFEKEPGFKDITLVKKIFEII